MASANLTITIDLRTGEFPRDTEKIIEHAIALVVEPVAKRELKKQLAEMREEREAAQS
jgi:hypothetical protein